MSFKREGDDKSQLNILQVPFNFFFLCRRDVNHVVMVSHLGRSYNCETNTINNNNNESCHFNLYKHLLSSCFRSVA